MDRNVPPPPNEGTPHDATNRRDPDQPAPRDPAAPNPPFTTKDGITAPKFGSAGSGGAELEPGPEKD